MSEQPWPRNTSEPCDEETPAKTRALRQGLTKQGARRKRNEVKTQLEVIREHVKVIEHRMSELKSHLAMISQIIGRR